MRSFLSSGVVLFGLQLYLFGLPVYSDEDHLTLEAKLIRHLTNVSTYERTARPVENATQPVFLNTSFNLNSIVELNDKEQRLEVSAFLKLSWFDNNLGWNASDYFGLNKIGVNSEQIWVPDIGMFNSLDANFDFSIKGKIKLFATSAGQVGWNVGGIWKVGCTLDMTYFPFDDQECSLQFGSWSMDGHMMQIISVDEHIDLDNYNQNGEWDITNNHIEAATTYLHPDERDTYWSVYTVNMNLKRKSGFYILNIIFPCVSISLLVLMVFCVPSESGEKVSLGITILLAFSVFQLVIADTMPKTSDTTPILVIYLSLLMGISAVSTVLTVAILNLFHHGGDIDMPHWMQYIVFNILAKLTRQIRESNMYGVSRKQVTPVPPDLNKDTFSLSDLDNGFVQTNITKVEGYSSKDTTSKILQEILQAKHEKRKSVEDHSKEEDIRKKWVSAARICDKFLMFVYLITTTVITIVCLMIIPSIPRPAKELHH